MPEVDKAGKHVGVANGEHAAQNGGHLDTYVSSPAT